MAPPPAPEELDDELSPFRPAPLAEPSSPPPPPVGHPAASPPPSEHSGSSFPESDAPEAAAAETSGPEASGPEASAPEPDVPAPSEQPDPPEPSEVLTTPGAAYGTPAPPALRGASAPARGFDGETAGPRGPGRHSSVDTRQGEDLEVSASGSRVVVIGGCEPLGGIVAQRLILAGHRLAVNDVALPAEARRHAEHADPARPVAEPVSLPGDRSDAEEIVHTVARAEVALGGLDALVVLPGQSGPQVNLDADAATWADEWSMALTTEVLATACAAHIAARSFLARRTAGRIILVTNGRDGSAADAMPTSAIRAAISRLGADLIRELGPHGIGVSVVATGPGGTHDFALGQVADVIDALLRTPVLSGLTSNIG